jgi:hypothetical protein
MTRIYQILIVVGTIAATILLTGCGQSTNSSTAGPNTATPAPTFGATNVPTHTVNTGPVILHIDASSYQSNDTIVVTLKNQSNQTIYFPDHLTNCSVVLLLRLPVQPLTSDAGQIGINPCKLEILTRMHSLAPGQNLVVKLIAQVNGWAPGIYHATLTYHTSLQQPTIIYSGAFTVGPFSPQP